MYTKIRLACTFCFSLTYITYYRQLLVVDRKQIKFRVCCQRLPDRDSDKPIKSELVEIGTDKLSERAMTFIFIYYFYVPIC